MNEGQKITIKIELDLSSDYSDKDGEYIELGYYQDGTEHRIFCDQDYRQRDKFYR